MIASGRRGRALLVSLSTGAFLVGGVAVAAPVGALQAGWTATLGSTLSVPAPARPTSSQFRPQVVRIPAQAVPNTGATTADPATAAGTTAGSGPTVIPAPRTAPPTTTTRPSTTRAPRSTTNQPITTRPSTPKPAPPTTRRPAPTNPPASVPSEPLAAVVVLTDNARAAAGCAPLRRDSRIDTAAQRHSADMSSKGYFAHDSRNGDTFADRIVAAGYPSPGGENIARGQRTAAEVVRDWMNSPGHRRNIEDCSFTTIGVGLATDGMYWTQDFGR